MKTKETELAAYNIKNYSSVIYCDKVSDSTRFIILHGDWRREILARKSVRPIKTNSPVTLSLKKYLQPRIYEQHMLFSTNDELAKGHKDNNKISLVLYESLLMKKLTLKMKRYN